MADIALEFSSVWKKFSRAERYDSLRDLIPALLKRPINGKKPDQLRKKEFWALKDVSFSVKRGEALGIIGPNGAGKSTVLRLLSGILRPSSGKIAVRGRLSALIEVGAGFHPDLTGRENIYLNGAILGMRRNEIVSKLDAIVEFSGVADFIDTPVKRYSSGMTARLGFSIAAHVEPDILLVDEVLSVGDAGFQAKCITRMQEIARNGTIIVFVSHYVSQVARICSSILVLDHGQVKHNGEVNQAISLYYDLVNDISRNNELVHAVPARSIHIRTADSFGNEIDSVCFGDSVNLQIKSNLPSGYPESHLIIKIGSLTGENYLLLNSDRADVTVKPGPAVLMCTFSGCRLLPKRYRMTAFLIDSIAGRVLDEIPQPDIIVRKPQTDVAAQLPNSEYAVLDVLTTWTAVDK